MSWLSGHLNGVILQTLTKLLVERSTSWFDERSTSQLVEPASSCKLGIKFREKFSVDSHKCRLSYQRNCSALDQLTALFSVARV